MQIRKPSIRNNKGISDVMGALLLIAVAVIAVSGIAVMVAEMQKSEMERQSNIEAVEKENIRIMSVLPTVNDSTNLFESLKITAANLNSRDSRVAYVMINDRPANNYTSTDDYNQEKNFSFYDRLRIPAGGDRIILIDFNESYRPEYNLSAEKPLKVVIVSENANYFMEICNPPKAVIKTSIETEDLGIAERDVLILDGSDSFDDGSVVGYNWSIFNSTSNLTHRFSGEKVRAALNYTGPLYVNLTVFDDSGMRGKTGIYIPENDNFNPPVRIETSQSSYVATDDIDVTVMDMHGNAMEGVSVSFVSLSGDYALSAYVDDTDAGGVASVTVDSVTTPGVLRIIAGRIFRDVQIS
ncbi:MAG: hypothetical protein JW724_04495 [Candidatus Altiarchaeota archaeon]|nr:hypothetical protein [Candidatus Altiarchaeota archaeon]